VSSAKAVLQTQKTLCVCCRQTRKAVADATAGKMEAFFNEREKLGIKPGCLRTGADAALTPSAWN
jgi:hypothetical protein